MNKRIRELAEQASKLSRQEHPELEQGVTLNDILGNTERKVYVVDDITTQKFAELIVKECANQCTHDGPFTAEVVWGKQFREKILKHFGVE
jgi:hypothetical protein